MAGLYVPVLHPVKTNYIVLKEALEQQFVPLSHEDQARAAFSDKKLQTREMLIDCEHQLKQPAAKAYPECRTDGTA